jgi:hypothetical protein
MFWKIGFQLICSHHISQVYESGVLFVIVATTRYLMLSILERRGLFNSQIWRPGLGGSLFSFWPLCTLEHGRETEEKLAV